MTSSLLSLTHLQGCFKGHLKGLSSQCVILPFEKLTLTEKKPFLNERLKKQGAEQGFLIP